MKQIFCASVPSLGISPVQAQVNKLAESSIKISASPLVFQEAGLDLVENHSAQIAKTRIRLKQFTYNINTNNKLSEQSEGKKRVKRTVVDGRYVEKPFEYKIKRPEKNYEYKIKPYENSSGNLGNRFGVERGSWGSISGGWNSTRGSEGGRGFSTDIKKLFDGIGKLLGWDKAKQRKEEEKERTRT